MLILIFIIVFFLAYTTNLILKQRLLLNQKDSTISALQDALDAKTGQLIDTAATLIDTNLKLAEANMTSQRLLTFNNQYTRDAKKGTATVSCLKEQVKEMKACLKVIEAYKDNLLEQNTKLHEFIKTKDREVDAVEEILATLKEENAALKTENAHLHDSFASKDAEGYEMAMQIRYKADELHTMTMQMEELDHALGHLTDYVEYLQDHLKDKDAECQAWQANASGTVRAFTQQVDELLEQKEVLEAENERLAEDLEGLVKEVESKELEEEVQEPGVGFVQPDGAGGSEGGYHGEEQREVEGVSNDAETLDLNEFDDVQVIEGVEIAALVYARS